MIRNMMYYVNMNNSMPFFSFIQRYRGLHVRQSCSFRIAVFGFNSDRAANL